MEIKQKDSIDLAERLGKIFQRIMDWLAGIRRSSITVIVEPPIIKVIDDKIENPINFIPTTETSFTDKSSNKSTGLTDVEDTEKDDIFTSKSLEEDFYRTHSNHKMPYALYLEIFSATQRKIDFNTLVTSYSWPNLKKTVTNDKSAPKVYAEFDRMLSEDLSAEIKNFDLERLNKVKDSNNRSDPKITIKDITHNFHQNDQLLEQIKSFNGFLRNADSGIRCSDMDGNNIRGNRPKYKLKMPHYFNKFSDFAKLYEKPYKSPAFTDEERSLISAERRRNEMIKRVEKGLEDLVNYLKECVENITKESKLSNDYVDKVAYRLNTYCSKVLEEYGLVDNQSYITPYTLYEIHNEDRHIEVRDILEDTVDKLNDLMQSHGLTRKIEIKISDNCQKADYTTTEKVNIDIQTITTIVNQQKLLVNS